MKNLLVLTPVALLLALAAGCSPSSTSAPPAKAITTPSGDHAPAGAKGHDGAGITIDAKG